MRFSFALLFLTFLCTCVRAQTPTPDNYSQEKNSEKMMGITDRQTLDEMMFYVPGIGSSAPTDLLRQNIKSYMMPIRKAPNARMEWAYALTSALEYYYNLNNNYKENLSPDYLAMSLANQGTQPNMEDGLRFLATQGTVSAGIVSFGSVVIPGAVYSVPKVKISNFGYRFQRDTKDRNKIFEVKKALSRGNPVLVELATPAGFDRVQGGTYLPSGPNVETHFLTITGYDSDAETFELRGSFGRMWGDGGYVRLGFADFGKLANLGYVLIPAP
ncbi:C1 family peptidase [Neolewinella antarctica]|uniref:Peptidase C1A papain C-terminal domain-containing protein n=1 Tax=Neolewinella antarctica TaxID=442734 RepID=A0ABX0XB00_9BACT|nr:C1 family peptidase [Neolewinella antarctica]NJC26446.1 hypothetical protein [Neolewinella antarctica]